MLKLQNCGLKMLGLRQRMSKPLRAISIAGQKCLYSYSNRLHHAVQRHHTDRAAFVTFELPRDHTFYRPSQALKLSQIDRVQKQFLSTRHRNHTPSQSRLPGPLLISFRICACFFVSSYLATAANSTQMCSPWHYLQDIGECQPLQHFIRSYYYGSTAFCVSTVLLHSAGEAKKCHTISTTIHHN